MQEQQNLTIDRKPYQVFVVGRYDEQNGKEFILNPLSEPSEEMKARGLGNSPYLNLQLIQKFDAADNGDFGGDSDATQATMFQNDSPRHFAQLKKAIEGGAWEEDVDIPNRDGEPQPVIKLKGLFKDSYVHSEPVPKCYLVFRLEGEYVLQMSGRIIGNNWVEYPATITSITKFFGGNDANETNILSVMARERERRYIDAFNCVEIDALAAKMTRKVDASFIAEIAEQRITAIFDANRLAEEKTILNTVETAPATAPAPTVTVTPEVNPTVVNPEAQAPVLQPTGTEGVPEQTV